MTLIVLTAPSGAGKTTIARRLMAEVPGLRFSVSATTREPRPAERHGVDYVFLSEDEFRQRLAEGDFLEHEEVYPGRFYGTLKQAVEETAMADDVRAVVLDVDVKGAINVKRLYGDAALTLFIAPPSLAALAERLHGRGLQCLVFSRVGKHREEDIQQPLQGLGPLGVPAEKVGVLQDKGPEARQDQFPVAERVADLVEQLLQVAMDAAKTRHHLKEHGKGRVDGDLGHRRFQQVGLERVGVDLGRRFGLGHGWFRRPALTAASGPPCRG